MLCQGADESHASLLLQVNPQFYAFRWITLLLTQVGLVGRCCIDSTLACIILIHITLIREVRAQCWCFPPPMGSSKLKMRLEGAHIVGLCNAGVLLPGRGAPVGHALQRSGRAHGLPAARLLRHAHQRPRRPPSGPALHGWLARECLNSLHGWITPAVMMPKFTWVALILTACKADPFLTPSCTSAIVLKIMSAGRLCHEFEAAPEVPSSGCACHPALRRAAGVTAFGCILG